MDTLEVERRYKLTPIEQGELETLLSAKGWQFAGAGHQEDLYYTSRHKDFILSKECLRIRTEDGQSTVTWKPPSDAAMEESTDFWKQEVDVRIVASEISALRTLLERLDFVEFVIVRKARRTFVKGAVEVVLDTVEGAGTFVEIEVKSSNVIKARELLHKTASDLELDNKPVNKTPYRDLVPRVGA